VANELQWNPCALDQGEVELIRRAATWLRDNPTRGTYAGLSSEDAYPFAALLDYLATELPHLDPDVRRLAIDRCRLMQRAEHVMVVGHSSLADRSLIHRPS
jgi:hypothetical protein